MSAIRPVFRSCHPETELTACPIHSFKEMMTTHGRKELTSSPVSALVAGFGVHKRASMTFVVRRPNLLVTKGTAMTEWSDSMKIWKDRCIGIRIRVDARGNEELAGPAGSVAHLYPSLVFLGRCILILSPCYASMHCGLFCLTALLLPRPCIL